MSGVCSVSLPLGVFVGQPSRSIFSCIVLVKMWCTREGNEEFPEPLPPVERTQLVIDQHPLRIRCCAKKCHQKEGTLTCSSCRAVRYCSVECRRHHWSQHKVHCIEVKKRKEELVRLAEPLGKGTKSLSILKTVIESYLKANVRFQSALKQCGEESRSELAFRLQAENFLNMMRLSYTGRPNEWRKTMILGAMVAGHMDQEALNFIRYLIYLQ